jgi:hypoxanthine phosphoribosyltransferase
MSTLLISWDEYKGVLTTLAKQLPQDAVLWGIPRGGALAALMLSYIRDDLCLLSDRTIFNMGVVPGLIVVDDISDTGETIKYYSRVILPQDVKFAALYARHGCKTPLDFVGMRLPPDEDRWLVFPYERVI